MREYDRQKEDVNNIIEQNWASLGMMERLAYLNLAGDWETAQMWAFLDTPLKGSAKHKRAERASALAIRKSHTGG